MIRYFDIEKDRLVMDLKFDSNAAVCTVSDIEIALGVEGLREIDEEEFVELKQEYSREVE